MELENKDSIPEVAKKQAEKAEALHRQLYPDQYPKEEPKGEGTPKEGETPKPGEAAKDAEPPKPAEKPKEEAPKPQETPKEEDWKQKYETLHGKYNAEVPQLHMTIASLQNMMKQLQGEIGTLKTAKEAAPPPKEEPKKETPAEAPSVKTLKEEYPDIFEAVSAMIESAVAAKVATGSPKADAGSGKPAPSSQTPPASTPTNPRATFDFYLNRDVPDWGQINVDPEFHKFLQDPDPAFQGLTKLQSIQAAYDAADFTTVIGHFKDFKSKKAAPANPNPNNPNPGNAPEEKFLAPPKGGKGGAPPSPGPTVTPADIAKFYKEASRGLWGPLDGEKYRKEEARLLTALTRT
jgi:hypothetical protein